MLFIELILFKKIHFKDTFKKPCVTGLQPLCGQCPIINIIKNIFK